VLEMLLPEYTRQLLENYQNVFSQVASQLRWLHFDDASRLVTRVGFLDDGWIRVRLDGHWDFTGELLRELSWTFYNIAESNRLLDSLAGALSSRATDSLRVSVVTVLPESPFNLSKVAGTVLTGRDWSLDFARLQNLDVPLSSRASESTLGTVASLVTGLSAVDYDIISLDLSTARTDDLVASNVIFLRILDSTTSTAQYTLKLFSTTKKTVTQDMAPPGTVFERLRRASVYVSNPAQPAGTKLDLFVLMG
jgi:hypothetical protein